jgi:hypothetical protein
MRYLRLMRRDGLAQDKAAEQTRLAALLATMPGVSEFTLHAEHPKGGYRVACTIDAHSFDSVIATLEREGWMSAI